MAEQTEWFQSPGGDPFPATPGTQLYKRVKKGGYRTVDAPAKARKQTPRKQTAKADS